MRSGNSFRKRLHGYALFATCLSLPGQICAENGQPIVSVANTGTDMVLVNTSGAIRDLSRGRELFGQDFRDYDGFHPEGDGLGPMFNASSCTACHHQGGEGGGGGLRHNVDILTLTQRTVDQVPQRRLTKIHAGFRDPSGQFVPSIVLHQYSTDPRYADSRKVLLGKRWIQFEDDEPRLERMVEREPHRMLRPAKRVYVVHSQRNTPALFGSGSLDLIPEELIREQAKRPKRFDVRGRVSELSGDKLGRFGWRAQLPNLEEFVLSACANELGLEVEGHSQTRNPIDGGKSLPSPEVSKNDTNALVTYVASLDSPSIEFTNDLYDHVLRGLRTFEDVGCAECHVRHMGPAKNVFSDVLLHDMGEDLSDPLGASPEIETITSPNPEGNGTRSFFEPPKAVNVYYVGTVLTRSVKTVPNTDDPFTDVVQRFAETTVDPRQEWRTPPLWGCADSAPYMHDGRAATLEDAIQMHGGEANLVRQRFVRLTKEKREDLLTFLGCLKSPSI